MPGNWFREFVGRAEPMVGILGGWRGKLLPVFLVSEPQFPLDFGNLFEFIEKFFHAEIGDHEFTIFEGGGQALSADFDHALHGSTMGVHITDIEFDAVLREKGHRFAAPGATALDVEGGRASVFWHGSKWFLKEKRRGEKLMIFNCDIVVTLFGNKINPETHVNLR